MTQHDRLSEFAGYVVKRLYSAGLKLESARSIVRDDPACERIRAATDEIDQLINDIRRVTALNPSTDTPVALEEHMAFTARELQARALDAAARLEQRDNVARQGWWLEHRVEIKRWQAFAEQAEQMARRWEQP